LRLGLLGGDGRERCAIGLRKVRGRRRRRTLWWVLQRPMEVGVEDEVWRKRIAGGLVRLLRRTGQDRK